MRISIVGTGYVGLVSGVGFSEKGYEVVCVDINRDIVANLNGGVPHFYEPGLDDALRDVVGKGMLRATTDLVPAVKETDVTFIAVGTPDRDGQIDLSQVRSTAEQIGRAMKAKASFHTVVVKSTVVPGTTDSVVKPILEESSGLKIGRFGLAMNPEFLREGEAVADVRSPDRIVVGSEDVRSRELLASFFSVWNADIFHTNSRTAEMIKYANNAFLAAQISISNEIANLCESVTGIDSSVVLEGVKLDHRWSPKDGAGARIAPPILSFLKNGCGYGGSCFPKDVQALIAVGRSYNTPMTILEAVHNTNRAQPLKVVASLLDAIGSVAGKKIVLFGLSFKPNTDDVRESPSLTVARALFETGAEVHGADPKVRWETLGAFSDVFAGVTNDWREAARDADAAVFLTAWPEYSGIPPAELLRVMRGNLVVDGRGMLHRERYEQACHFVRVGHRSRRVAADGHTG